MSPSMGGEIAEVFDKVANKRFICLGPCHKDLPADGLVGYPHDGGHADEDGNKWWLYVKCLNDKCGYATAVWKIIKNQIPAYEQQIKVIV